MMEEFTDEKGVSFHIAQLLYIKNVAKGRSSEI